MNVKAQKFGMFLLLRAGGSDPNREWAWPIRQLRLALFLWTSCLAGLAVTAAETNRTGTYPIDLPAALKLAGAQNLDVQIARERLKEADANRTSALEQLFPWGSPGFQYHRRDGMAQAVPAGTLSDAHYDSYAPGGTFVAQLSLGDAIYNSLSSKQLWHASDHALASQRQSAVLAAAQGYFELSKSKALVEVIQEAVKTAQDYQQQLHTAVGTGIAFRGDELRVKSQAERYQISLRKAYEVQRISAAKLAQILHLDAAIELVPQDNGLGRLILFGTNAPLDSLVQLALQSRPELKQSHALVAASHAAKDGAVYGPLIPSIGAQVFAGGLGGGPDHGASRFGAEEDYLVGFSWRIGPGGLFDFGRMDASKARLAADELAESKMKDAITFDVVSSVTQMQSLYDQIELAGKNLVTAGETLRLTRERKEFGVGIVLEDIQAQQELTQARSEYVTAIAEFNKAQYALNYAVGGEPQAAKPVGPSEKAVGK